MTESLKPALPLVGEQYDSETASRFVSELIARMPKGHTFQTADLLEEHPELRQFDSAVVNLAYEQYCRQIEAGESVDVSRFVKAFPDHQESLLEMLELHRLLDADDILTNPATKNWPNIGDTFRGFELIEELGRGAFSRVFLATQAEVGDRFVVVKVCVLGQDEAKSLGQLQHPQVVRVFSVHHVQTSELTAICMPYLSRATLLDVVQGAFKKNTPRRAEAITDIVARTNHLDARLEAETSDPQDVDGMKGLTYAEAIAEIGRQVALALAYTHRRGYCHCDVKPSNVLITRAGRAKLFDFNLASRMDDGDGNVRGTIVYMAPEQLRAIADPNDKEFRVDHQCDVFSYGVTIYQLLTGKLPYGELPPDASKQEVAELLHQRQRSGPLSLLQQDPAVGAGIARIVERCLEFDPARRPPTMQVVAEQLEQQLKPARRALRWLRSRRRLLAGTALLFSGAAALTGTGYALADWAEWGHDAYRRENYERASLYYSRAITMDSDNPNLWFWRGRANLGSGSISDAGRDFEQAKRLLKDQSMKIDGRLSASLGYFAAMTAWEQTLENAEAAPENREYLSNNSKKLFLLAKIRFEEAEKQGVVNAAIYNNLGYCHVELGETEIAIGYFEKAAQYEPVPAASWYRLALFGLQATSGTGNESDLKNLDRAAVRIRKAIEGGASQGSIYRTAAYVHARRCSVLGAKNVRKQDLAPVLHFCKKSLEAGVPLSQMEHLADFYPQLKGNAEYMAMLKTPRLANPNPAPLQRFLDPLAGTEEPIYLIPRQPLP